MSTPDIDMLDDDLSGADADVPPEIAVLRNYLPLAAVADEPELQTVLARARRLGTFLTAVVQMRSQDTTLNGPLDERPLDMPGDRSKRGHSAGELRLAPLNQDAAELTATATTSSLLPQRLGDYEIFERLDAGGMGTVYRACQRSTGRIVAVKVMLPHRLESVEARRRFQREGQLTLGLHHAHLVEILAAGEESGRAYLAMEYLGGHDVGHIVRERGPLRVADACELIRQAALGVDFLSRQGLVHRDLKPSNLMLSGSPAIVKVLDLGLASDRGAVARSELTQSPQIIGTYDYLAPEQALDPRAVDVRSDIYSLGCTLYCLLAGFAPFARAGEGSPVSILLAHQAKTATALDSLRTDVPALLASIVARAIEKQPTRRFATAAEFADALAAFTADANLDQLLASTATTADQQRWAVAAKERRWRRHSPGLASVFVAVVLATIGFVWVALGPGPQRRRFAFDSRGKQSSAVNSASTPAASPEGPAANSASDRAAAANSSSSAPRLAGPFTPVAAKQAQRAWARQLRLKGIDVVNSIGMPLRVIPPGSFAGEVDGSGGSASHPVLLGTHEVTEREFAQVMGIAAVKAKGDEKSNLPARGLAWHEAIEFCRRLSDLPAERNAGRCYSLPGSEVWQWACRAGAAVDMPWNDLTIRDHAVANEPAPRPAGTFPPNAFGLVDMRGNVAEWTADWLPEPAPDRQPRQAPVTPFMRPVVRGGSYESETADQLRSTAFRTHFPESPPRPDCGFRVVCYPTGWPGLMPSSTPPSTHLPDDDRGFSPMITRDTALNGWGFPGGDVVNADGLLVQTIGAGSDWGSLWYGRHGNLRDFEMRGEMRIEGPVDECVLLFRANVLETSWETGSHYRFHLAGRRMGWLYRSTPAATDTIAAAPASLLSRLRVDTWNRLALRCEGRRVRIWLAGELAVDLSDAEPNVCLQGPLSFLLRGSDSGPRRSARFRELRIRLLDTSAVTEPKSEPKPMAWTMGQKNLPPFLPLWENPR